MTNQLPPNEAIKRLITEREAADKSDAPENVKTAWRNYMDSRIALEEEKLKGSHR